MKKSLLRAILMATAICAGAGSLMAQQTFMAQGYVCTLNPDGKSVSIAGDPDVNYSANMEIQDYVLYQGVEYDITGISDRGFENRTEFQTFRFGPKMTTIGKEAFRNCSNLTTLRGTGGYGYAGITKMGESAFWGCEKLKEINFPVLTNLPDDAFRSCTALSTVTLPEVTGLGDRALSYCSSLTTIDMPKLSYIGEGAFLMDESLKSVKFNPGITIGAHAFNYCWGLEEVLIPYKVNGLQRGAFANCTGLQTVYLLNENFPQIDTEDNKTGLVFNYNGRRIYCIDQIYDFVKSNFGDGLVINLNSIMVPTFSEVSESGFSVAIRPAYIPGAGLPQAPTVTDLSGSTIYPDGGLYRITGDKALISYKFYDTELTYYITPPAPGSVADIDADGASATPTGYYDLQGRRLDAPARGVTIVRYSDGSSRKIMTL